MSPFDKWRNQISLCIHYSKMEPRPLETSLIRVTLRMHSLFQRKLSQEVLFVIVLYVTYVICGFIPTQNKPCEEKQISVSNSLLNF